jgi:hypothetical protein
MATSVSDVTMWGGGFVMEKQQRFITVKEMKVKV